MLSLKSTTPQAWFDSVEGSLDELLIDHAHCEKKAAGTAMNLIFAYVEQVELVQAMTEIVNEELEHFHMVLDRLNERGAKFRRLQPSCYGRRLNDLVRKQEPGRAVDRLLVAALIEARSCERFGVLRDQLQDRQLGEFFGSLFESEARHHSTYVRLATKFAAAEEVRARLEELAVAEAEILATSTDPPRMHS